MSFSTLYKSIACADNSRMRVCISSGKSDALRMARKVSMACSSTQWYSCGDCAYVFRQSWLELKMGGVIHFGTLF